jgi:hypothetical protein
MNGVVVNAACQLQAEDRRIVRNLFNPGVLAGENRNHDNCKQRDDRMMTLI